MCVGEDDAILADKPTISVPSGGSSVRSALGRAPLLLWPVFSYFPPTFSDAGGMYE